MYACPGLVLQNDWASVGAAQVLLKVFADHVLLVLVDPLVTPLTQVVWDADERFSTEIVEN